MVFRFIFLSLIVAVSCGPRSGIHREETENAEGQKVLGCGNAERDMTNYAWAQKTLEITGDGERGRKLFKQNCAVCHSLSDQELTGPGLKGFFNRIPAPKTNWLRNYILDSKSVHASGDKYARQLWKRYPEYRMNAFKNELTEKDLNDLMIFTVANTE